MIKLNELEKGMELELIKDVEGISYSKGDTVEIHNIENDKILLKFGVALGVFNLSEVNEYFKINRRGLKETFQFECYKSDYIGIDDKIYQGNEEICEVCNEFKNIKPSKLKYVFDIDGIRTTCSIFDKYLLIGKASVKLHEDDEFDIKIGIKVAKLKAEMDINSRKLENIYRKIELGLDNSTRDDDWLNIFKI